MADGSISSSHPQTPAWVRLAMPSIADLIFVALLCLLLFTPLSVRLLGDAGIGWHIRTGQQILATHAVPRVDSFSSTMSGKPWFAWEWLYDLLVGKLDASWGLNGVVWFTAAVIAAVFASTFRLLIRRGMNVLCALALVLLAISASTIHFLARPHVLSWLFTLAWFVILDSSEKESFEATPWERKHWLWALPALMLVWVNVHGGFLVGFVLLGIYWFGAVWNWYRASGNRIEGLLFKLASAQRVKSLFWVGCASALASLVNPYGWKLHAHIYSYLTNRFLMDHIDEFQSPNFHGAAQKCFLALLIFSVAVLVVRGRELRLSQGFTVLFAIYAGLYASRNIPVSSILLVLIVGPLLAQTARLRSTGVLEVKEREGFLQRMTAIEFGQHWLLWPILVLIATLGIAANQGRLGSSILMDAHFASPRMPLAAVDYIEKKGIKGPILSPDYWGGYLIYRLAPTTKVVVDDRHDLYGAEFFKLYLTMMHGERGWEGFLAEHEAPCVLLPRNSPLASLLLVTRDWRTVYADDGSIAFARAQ